MTIKSIIKMGNKKLSTPSLPVKYFASAELRELIRDMQDTMQEQKGVGIAAPQIGCNLRVIMFGFGHNPRYPTEKPVPFTILINPVIEILSEEMVDGWEGCLSVPGLRGLVPRYQKIKYEGYDPEGNYFSRIAFGFHARMVQHEYDHVEGILFPNKLKSLQYFGYEDELKDIIWPQKTGH